MAVDLRSSAAGVPVVWLALELPARRVVGHACWESAAIKSAKAGGKVATAFVAKLAAAGAAEATVRKRGRLFGLSAEQVEAIVAPLAGGAAASAALEGAGGGAGGGAAPVAARDDPEYAPLFLMLKVTNKQQTAVFTRIFGYPPLHICPPLHHGCRSSTSQSCMLRPSPHAHPRPNHPSKH